MDMTPISDTSEMEWSDLPTEVHVMILKKFDSRSLIPFEHLHSTFCVSGLLNMNAN